MKFELVVQFINVKSIDDNKAASNILAEALLRKMDSYLQSKTIETLQKKFHEQLNNGSNRLTEGASNAGQTCDISFTLAQWSLELCFSDVKILPSKDKIPLLIKEIAEKFASTKVNLEVRLSSEISNISSDATIQKLIDCLTKAD